MIYLQLSSFFLIIYLIKAQPMDCLSINIFEISNEICVLLCSTVLITFTDHNIQEVEWIGWIYIAITSLLIVYSVASVIQIALKQLWEKI